MKINSGMMLRVSALGLLIVVGVNALGYFYWKQPAAIPFSEYWWVAWFPAYIFWLVTFVAGLRGRARERESGDNT